MCSHEHEPLIKSHTNVSTWICEADCPDGKKVRLTTAVTTLPVGFSPQQHLQTVPEHGASALVGSSKIPVHRIEKREENKS